MGPGLVLALALLAPGLRAETPAGLDAQGVDPRAAVENKYGLDVRDELGRPVTREQVLKDIKAASVAKVAATAFTSSLPKAAAVLSALELLSKAAEAFRLASEGYPIETLLPGLPGGKPRLSALILMLLCSAAVTASICRRPETTVPATRSRQSRIEVLRC